MFVAGIQKVRGAGSWLTACWDDGSETLDAYIMNNKEMKVSAVWGVNINVAE